MRTTQMFEDAVTGQPWGVRLVKHGERHGVDDRLVNDGETQVEFYDMRYPHKEFGLAMRGQFVSSYYAATLLSGGANPSAGLDLMGYAPTWKISRECFGDILKWIEGCLVDD